MKKALILGLGVALMALQANAWAATCATEKKAKGYTVKVLSPATGSVINKSDAFLLQWQDMAQSMGAMVTVGLHKLKGKKKARKAVKRLTNQHNTGSALLTGASLTNPGAGAKAKDKYFFRITGAGTSSDSGCFSFAPQLKGAAIQPAEAELHGTQQSVRTYANQIAALEKQLAALKKQIAKGGGGSGPQGPQGEKGEKGDKGDTGPQGEAGSGGLTEAQVVATIEAFFQARFVNFLTNTFSYDFGFNAMEAHRDSSDHGGYVAHKHSNCEHDCGPVHFH
jgi:hypothetical protein